MALETQKWPRKTLLGGQMCVLAAGKMKKAVGDAGRFERGDLVVQEPASLEAEQKFVKMPNKDDGALTSGTDKPTAIVYEDVDATAADTMTTLLVMGDVKSEDIIWPENATAENKRRALDALRERGIYTRTIS